jgi:hypothetical protein
MANRSDGDIGLRLRLSGRREVRSGLRDTQGDLDDTADAADTLGQRGLQAAKGLAAMVDEKITGGLKGLGGAAKTAGVALAKGLAVGVAAAGAAVGVGLAAAITKGIESEAVNRSLQATLGMTPAEAAEAGTIAGRIFAQNYGESRDEVAMALSSLSRSTGLDVTNAQLQEAARYALDLASAFEVDVSESARAAGQLVRTNLVDTLSQAYDLITLGFQRGADRGEDFLDTLDQYNSTFAALGLSGEQAVGLITQAMDAGVYASDNAADALRETGTLITAGGESIDTALQSIGLNAGEIEKAFNDGGSAASTALDQVYDKLRTTDDATLRSAAATALIGSQYEDLGDSILAMDPSTAVAALGKIDGAASRLDQALGQGVAPAFETVKRSVEGLVYGAGAALAQRWGPDVEDVLKRVSTGVTTLGDDLPGLGADLQALVSSGDLTGLGTRIEQAFGLSAGTLTQFNTNTREVVTVLREDVLPTLEAVVKGLTQFAEHKITHTLPLITTATRFLAQHTEGLTKTVYAGLIAYGLLKTVLTVLAVKAKVAAIATLAQGKAQAFSTTTAGTWIGVKALELQAWTRSTVAAARNSLAMAANRVAYGASYLMTWLGVKGLEAAAWARTTAATAVSTGAALANRVAYGVSYLATFIAAKGLEFVAWARSTGATIASTIAQGAAVAASLAVRGATVLATAAQWLFNAALSANPIGLVVAGIALLVGGLVWFFTKTDTGRAAWEKLTGAFRAGVDWITGTAVPAIKIGLGAAIDIAREKFDKVRSAVGGFVDKVKDGITWVAKLADKLSGGLIGKALDVVGIDGAAAEGGPIRKGQTFLVGEEGPELFTAGISGKIMPSDALASLMSTQVPTARMTSTPSIEVDENDTSVSDGLASIDLTVHVDVDGRTIATATVNGLHENAAWT